MKSQPLGEILIEAGLVSLDQIEFALYEQANKNLKIGQILAHHNWIKQETADFFVEQWPQILRAQEKKPLVYYFKLAGLLDERQIDAVLQKQQQKSLRPRRFHKLVVQLGYLEQTTVDFFLSKIFGSNKIANSKELETVKSFEILRQYIQGQRDFSQITFKEAKLSDITLKEINLSGSKLKSADLNRANLSHSKLIKSDLTHANLAKANLMFVDFSEATLKSANLQETNLDQANFTGADLSGAVLTKAYLFNASFASADLRGAYLDSSYPYAVYYDSSTSFDDSFDPQKAGWKSIN